MTTAFIGKEDAARIGARVGLVSSQANAELVDCIEAAGHETIVWSDWDAMIAEADSAADNLDVVFCDESSAGNESAGDVPVIRLPADAVTLEQLAPMLIELAARLTTARSQVRALASQVDGIRTGSAIVGNTPAIRRLRSAISRAADCDATVLIEGPEGSGKSLAARAIHLKSRRGDRELVVLEGSATTADALSKAIEEGGKTTAIIESVDQLPAAAQSVLVKHLKERSTSRAPSLVRLVTTTSAHLPELVARGAFREDLYYRLNAFPILVPGLHERVEDIQLLAQSILDVAVPATGRKHMGLTPAALVLLESMQWPGNVAQLEATVRRGQILAGGTPIDRQHLMAPTSDGVQTAAPASATNNSVSEEVELTEDSIRPFEEEEKFLLGRALQATKGNVRRAAQLLGIGRATLYRKIQQYHLRLH